MKEILKNIKSGTIIAISFTTTLIIFGTIYAAVNNIWTNPNTLEATSGNTLSSENWNKILSNQNVLSGALNNLKIQPTSTISGAVSYKGKQRKQLSGTMDFGNALYGCTDLGYGWKLPSMSELRSLRKGINENSTFRTSLNLSANKKYWADNFWREPDCLYVGDGTSINMSDGTLFVDNLCTSTLLNVVCLYD